MWWKGIIIVILSELQVIIYSQPVIINRYAGEYTPLKSEECYICPRAVDGYGSDIRDLHRQQTQISPSLRVPVNDCPCKFTGPDSEGSSSIFYPSLLGRNRPIERAQDPKQELKPLLQPEVGLASSVLETIKEATDEQYQEALARDASKIAMKAANPNLLDSESGTSKKLVTIVINPRIVNENDDAIPEASHFHETRCIHRPLESRRIWNSKVGSTLRIPKPNKLKHDMDNSPSNIQENFETKTNKSLESKLKINRFLLNGFSNKQNSIKERPDMFRNSGSMLKNIFTDHDNIKNSDISAINTLAALKNKLRHMTELRNTKHGNNDRLSHLADSNINILKNKPYNTEMRLPLSQLPSLDAVNDKQSPIITNLLKLRDVEFIHPQRKNISNNTRYNNKFLDLKSAGTESKGTLLKLNHNAENSDKCYTVNSESKDKESSEYLNDFESASIEGNTSLPSTIQSIVQEDLDEELLDDSTHVSNSENYDKSHKNNINNNNNIDIDLRENNIETDSEQSKDDEEILDSEVISTSMKQKVFQQEDDLQNSSLIGEDLGKGNSCNMQRPPTMIETNLSKSLNIEKKSNSLSRRLSQVSNLYKNDIKNQLELDDTSNLNSELSQSLQTPLKLSSESIDEDITVKDLQNLSNSLLTQENILKSKEANSKKKDVDPADTLDSNKTPETFNTNENKNMASELSRADSLDSTENDPEDYEYYTYDDRSFSTNYNTQIEPDNTTIPPSKHICNTSYNEINDLEEGYISASEMSSQASHINYDLLRPQLSDNYLRSSLPQDITDQSSIPALENNPLKLFELTSLAEIKKGITNIIDAGQQEEEVIGPLGSDPLNESSNTNSVISSDICRFKPLENDKSGLVQSRLKSYKTDAALPAVARVKPFTLESVYNDREGVRRTSLFLNRNEAKPFLETKPVHNSLGNFLGQRDNIFKSNTQNIFRDLSIPLPRSSTIMPRNEFSPLSDKSIKTSRDNLKGSLIGDYGVLNRRKGVTSDIFDSFLKNRENMMVKLKAIHKNFNEKYKKDKGIFDSTTAQSKNRDPSLKDKIIKLQVKDSQKTINPQTIFPERLAYKEPDLFLNSFLPQSYEKSLGKNNLLLKEVKNLHSIEGNDHIKQNLKKTQGLFSNVQKLINQQNTKEDKDVASYGNRNVKISFSTTTALPVTNNRLRTQHNDHIFPLNKIQKSNPKNSKLKDVSNVYETMLKKTKDSKNLPSDIVPVKSEPTREILRSKPESRTQKSSVTTTGMEPMLLKKTLLPLPDSSLRKEITTITNLREALRSKLANIRNNEKTIQQSKNKEIPITDAEQSPSENMRTIKTIINPLKENTPYRCTMMCVQDK